MASTRLFLTNFHIGAASGWDLFLVLIFLIAALIYGIFLGRNRMIILLLSSYFSLLISQVVPWSRLADLKWLGLTDGPSFSLKIIVFLALILLFYFLIPRSILSSVLRIRKRGDATWWQLLILSVVQIGLLIMIIFSFLPKEAIAEFGIWLRKIFIGPEAEFIWIALPILAIAVMRRPRKSED